jgi:prophage antirepressor-like protein
MNTLINPVVFAFEETHNVRIVLENNEPLFNANDVCEVLELTNSRKAVDDHVDEDDVTKREVIDSLGRTQEANFITEAGLYSLIFGSEKPEAKVFKRWVTHDLLPQLRKVGYYGTLELKERISLGNQMLGIVDRLAKSGGDLFIRRALMDRLREICLLLGQSTPDVALLGKNANQPALPGV